MILHFHSTFPFLQFWTNRTCFAKQAASVARPKAAWSVTARAAALSSTQLVYKQSLMITTSAYFLCENGGCGEKGMNKHGKNWITMALSTFLLEVSFERSWTTTWTNTILNLLRVQVPPKRKTFGTSQTRIWKWYPSPESGLGIWQAWKLCATSCTSYGTALPFFCLGCFHLNLDWNTGNTSAVCL